MSDTLYIRYHHKYGVDVFKFDVSREASTDPVISRCKLTVLFDNGLDAIEENPEFAAKFAALVAEGKYAEAVAAWEETTEEYLVCDEPISGIPYDADTLTSLAEKIDI